jgi:WhiB family redox-sensing transcriptional regulator
MAARLAAILAAGPACTGEWELFTGPAGIDPDDELPAAQEARIEKARDVCAGCPARRPCLAYALATLPTAGVWGGLTPEELHRLAAAGPDRLREAA